MPSSPPLPAPPGPPWRPAALEDAPAVARLMAAVDEAEHLDYVPGVEAVRQELSFPELDLARDTLLAALPGGDVAAFAWVWVKQVAARQRAVLWIEVHPAHAHLEGSLLAWAESRARARLAADPGRPGYLRQDLEEHRLPRRRALEEAGYRHARTFLEMRRALPAPPAAIPPAGIEVVPWSARLDDSTHAAAEDAFSLHWDVAPMSLEEWRRRVVGDPMFRPDLSRLAVQSGQVAAFCLAAVDPEHNARQGVAEMWIERVGTRRARQRQGLAALLLQHVMAAGAAAGLTRVALSVDQDNTTRASSLYQRLGFAAERRTLSYLKDIG